MGCSLDNPINKILENLYLGNFTASENIQQLKDLGIKKVLSVMDFNDFPNYKSEEIVHKYVEVSDFDFKNIIQYFGECLNFIKGEEKVLTISDYKNGPKYEPGEFIHKRIDITDYGIENIIQYFGECLKIILGEEKILVHCMAGASRSATIVIAYLMWIKKMKFDEALNFVISKRPIVDPNDGFREQLKIFEKLLENNNYDIDKINFSEIKWEPTPFFDDDEPILLHLDN